MMIDKDLRTRYEDEQELRVVQKYFNMEAEELVIPLETNGYRSQYPNKDSTYIKLVNNYSHEGFWIYNDKKFFSKPKNEVIECILKGSVFIVYNKSEGLIRIYNTADDMELLYERKDNHVNVDMELEQYIEELKIKLYL